MKKLFIGLSTAMILTSLLCTSVMANNYQFGETYGADVFGKPTTSSIAPDFSAIENVRRNKDVALFPPSYGIFGGNIPTIQTSRYHEPDTGKSTVTQIPEFGGLTNDISSSQHLSSLSGETTNINNSFANSLPPYSESNISISYSELGYTSKITSVTAASDGSIGSISVPRFNYSRKVYEGSTNAVMAKGVGHFESTSQWSGNVALLGHNRGSANHFYFVKDINIGDEIKYSTSEGERTYKVVYKERINEYDMSYLDYKDENILTLITCVENKQTLRWCVIASEIN